MTLIYPGGGNCDPNEEPCVGPDCPPASVGDPDNPIVDPGCLINCGGPTVCTGPDCVNGQCVGPECSYGEEGDWHVYWVCNPDAVGSNVVMSGEVNVQEPQNGGLTNLEGQNLHFKLSNAGFDSLGLPLIQIGDSFQYVDPNDAISTGEDGEPITQYPCFTYLGKKDGLTWGQASPPGWVQLINVWATGSTNLGPSVGSPASNSFTPFTNYSINGSCDCQVTPEPPQPETGCQDPSACNYSELATIHDQAICCYVTGCTDTEALNYNLNACCDDGSCCFTGGCTHYEAFNYDPFACYDDGSCCFVQGCMDATAFNYNDLACSPAECVPVEMGCADTKATNYNPSANTDDGSCTYPPKAAGCSVLGAFNYDPNALTANDNLCEWHIPRFCISDVDQPTGVYPLFSGTSNTNDVYLIYPPTALSGQTTTWINAANTTTIKNLVLSYTDPYVTALEVVLGTSISPGYNINYAWGGNKFACIIFLGYDIYYGDGLQIVNTLISPTPVLFGPMTSSGSTNNPNVTSIVRVEGECGGCGEQPSGCTDPSALNYDLLAVIEDNSCTYGGVYGCTNPYALNYDPLATIDDNSCIYEGVYGCTNPYAANYDPNANIDDGSCEDIGVQPEGCIDPFADNYTPGSGGTGNCSSNLYCLHSGCIDPAAVNYCAPCNVNTNSICTYPSPLMAALFNVGTALTTTPTISISGSTVTLTVTPTPYMVGIANATTSPNTEMLACYWDDPSLSVPCRGSTNTSTGIPIVDPITKQHVYTFGLPTSANPGYYQVWSGSTIDIRIQTLSHIAHQMTGQNDWGVFVVSVNI